MGKSPPPNLKLMCVTKRYTKNKWCIKAFYSCPKQMPRNKEKQVESQIKQDKLKTKNDNTNLSPMLLQKKISP